MKYLYKSLLIIYLQLNYLITVVVGITIVSFLLASPFFLQIQIPYEKDAFGQGYSIKELKDSDEATKEEEEAMEEADDDDD